MIGSIYCWGQGVAIDYARAMAAYKVAAEGGDAVSQHQVGFMYREGLGVDVDHTKAVPWLEKAAKIFPPPSTRSVRCTATDSA